MWDVLYIVITLLFFAAMFWYLLGCHRLGGDGEAAARTTKEPRVGNRDGR